MLTCLSKTWSVADFRSIVGSKDTSLIFNLNGSTQALLSCTDTEKIRVVSRQTYWVLANI